LKQKAADQASTHPDIRIAMEPERRPCLEAPDAGREISHPALGLQHLLSRRCASFGDVLIY